MDKMVVLALLAQIVTEAIARLFPRYTVHLAAVVGMAVAYVSGAGLLSDMGFPVTAGWIDRLLTGLVLAGGAGVVSALKKGMTARNGGSG